MGIEDHHDVGSGGGDLIAQPGITRNQVRVGSGSLQYPELLALHQAWMVRHHGRTDNFSNHGFSRSI